MKLSVVIPVLNESALILSCLSYLQGLRERGHEVIVVDGGSSDDTIELAAPLSDHCLVSSRPGRAAQMNRGAVKAAGDVLLFLHVDTILPEDVDALLRLEGVDKDSWGRFDVILSGRQPLLRVIEAAMNLRSRLSGIATGDQAMFVGRRLFRQTGGFPDIPLMEDIVLSRRLKRLRPPLCLRDAVITSSRRWEKRGILRTVLQMWWLRTLFYFGISPTHIARQYYGS
jgi:rSAM/selenodomain-associated transferase 2